MSDPDFSYPIREPTGLGLGTFDVYLIRQKLYQREFHSRCEFQTVDGQWHPLSDHPAFAEVIWLLGDQEKQKGVRRRAIGAGWKVAGQEEAEKRRQSVRLDKAPARPAARPEKKSSLLGRFFGTKK